LVLAFQEEHDPLEEILEETSFLLPFLLDQINLHSWLLLLVA
jgi:hypothetical protein